MSQSENIITPENARKIMGRDFIDIGEAANLFPCHPDDFAAYQKIPFSSAMLYYCNEEDSQFALVPGMPYQGRISKPLTIWAMKNYFSKDWPYLFAPCPPLDHPTYSFVNNSVCLPRWYLIAKKAVDKETIDRLFQKLEIGQCRDEPMPWEVECAVVYIYTWLLFFFLRQEEIFLNAPFICSDIYSPKHRSRVCLEFTPRQIIIFAQPTNKTFDIVPSIKPYIT